MWDEKIVFFVSLNWIFLSHEVQILCRSLLIGGKVFKDEYPLERIAGLGPISSFESTLEKAVKGCALRSIFHFLSFLFHGYFFHQEFREAFPAFFLSRASAHGHVCLGSLQRDKWSRCLRRRRP